MMMARAVYYYITNMILSGIHARRLRFDGAMSDERAMIVDYYYCVA